MLVQRAGLVRAGLAFLLVVSAGACAKRSRPAPPPPIIVTHQEAPEPEAPAPDPNAPSPEIAVQVEPEVIVKGESATLDWQSQHARQVVIEGIGAVDPTGRMKVFPEDTTTYLVRAEGPGGSTQIEVRVEVTARQEVTDPEASDLPITERFATFVKPVFFAFDSGQLSDEARLILDGNVRWLNRESYRHLQFVVEGHCDVRGTESYNLALGDQRAQVVRAYLIAQGIAADRVLTLSLGEERPFVDATDEESHALNRRAQFVMISEE